MAELTVMVTGAGALVGQGILRALRMSPLGLAPRIVTLDCDHRAAGHWLGDAAYTIPLAGDPALVPRLAEIAQREGASLLFVGTDVELPVMSRERAWLESTCGLRVVVSAPEVIAIADDKWLTAEFLRREGFPYPLSARASDWSAVQALASQMGYPLLAKPCRGARSVGVRRVGSEAELREICSAGPDYVIQELLPDEPGEYTAGCLVTGGACASVVVLRRDLRDGNTYRAYCEGDSPYAPTIARIAGRLGAEGPCNFQFRVRRGEPVIFEINARFSGTTPLRAICGYNEVEALLAHLTAGAPIPRPALRRGAVLRAWSDLFVEPDQLLRLERSGYLPGPACQHVPFIPGGGDGA